MSAIYLMSFPEMVVVTAVIKIDAAWMDAFTVVEGFHYLETHDSLLIAICL